MAEPTTPKAPALNKYVLTPLQQRLSTIGIPDARLEEWSKKWRFFFLLGFGRSGTAFMAGLLNQAPGAHVFHEPVLEDFFAHARAHYSSRAAQRYMRGFRKREIYQRVRRFPAGVYGEVNGTLRCHAEAIRLAQEAGAKRAIPLEVGGAFHSPLMESARTGMAEFLTTATISNPRVPVIANVTAEPVSDKDTIRRLLVEQITAPVRWMQTMSWLAEHGVTRIIEIGPGKVLTGLAKREMKPESMINLDTLADIQAFVPVSA